MIAMHFGTIPWWTAAPLALLTALCGSVGPLSAGDEAPAVKVGQKAPDIDLPAVLPDKKGEHHLRLSDYRGKKNVVLYFFPKALTGG